MYRVRESWTDERLDDFRGEVNRRFDVVDRRFDRVDERFDRVDERFEAMQRLMVQTSGAIIIALIGLIATQL
jgi:hypothetical protein